MVSRLSSHPCAACHTIPPYGNRLYIGVSQNPI
jgi:cytochrome c1